ncbi:MAG TPA: hypothetical protein VFK96_03100 [Gammaproteobacteria bacterium]|nr:hypothetical protein [Gammaproteobacteria bacterium]
MRGIFTMIGTFVIGSSGWWLGARIGPGVAVIVGAVGSGIGLYYGRKLFDEWLG